MTVVMVSAECCLDNDECEKMHFPGVLKPQNLLWPFENVRNYTVKPQESAKLYI